jgi:hypothetical protein
MNKLFALVAIFALAFAGCEDKNGDDDKNTSLTIINNCNRAIYSCVWNGTAYDTDDYQIASGEKSTRNVDPGSAYIFFMVDPWVGYVKNGRTQELVTIEKGESKTFIFLNSTIVVNTSNNQTSTILEL